MIGSSDFPRAVSTKKEVVGLSKSKRTQTAPQGAKSNAFWIMLGVAALLIVVGGYLLLAGRGSTAVREISLAQLAAMPDFVQRAPPNVQEAYRFAVANPEMLEQMPCYCGCGGVGHDDNIDCYVKSFNPDGSVAEFDNHAAF